MPNHVHLLIWPLQEKYDIAKVDSGIKGVMSKRYKKHLSQTEPGKLKLFMVPSRGVEVFRFWQPGGGFDRNLWNAKAIRQVIEYIEVNPVRKGLAASPEDYRWSSAYAHTHNAGVVPDRSGIPVVMLNAQS